jgi:hypothetical protein
MYQHVEAKHVPTSGTESAVIPREITLTAGWCIGVTDALPFSIPLNKSITF